MRQINTIQNLLQKFTIMQKIYTSAKIYKCSAKIYNVSAQKFEDVHSSQVSYNLKIFKTIA